MLIKNCVVRYYVANFAKPNISATRQSVVQVPSLKTIDYINRKYIQVSNSLLWQKMLHNNLPTNSLAKLHSPLWSLLHALTLKMWFFSGTSPSSLVRQTTVLLAPCKGMTSKKCLSSDLKQTSYLMTSPHFAALLGLLQFSVTEGV